LEYKNIFILGNIDNTFNKSISIILARKMPNYIEKYCYMKIHRHLDITVLALCDEKLIDRTLIKGRTKITISKKFYGEKKIKISEIEKMCKSATIINAIGKDVVDALSKIYDNIYIAAIWIENIPHVQIIKMG